MSKTERRIFADNLNKIISRSHLNQAQIADRLGVSRGTMSDYVNGNAYPRPERLAKLCEILGVSVQDLTTDSYTEGGQFIPTREELALAKQIHENPAARNLYNQIAALDPDAFQAVSALVAKLHSAHCH